MEGVQNIINSIQLILRNRDNRRFPHDLRVCLISARIPIEDCQDVCVEFEKKLKGWFHDSAWDRLKANFKEAKVTKFQARLHDTRDSLDLALNVCSM